MHRLTLQLWELAEVREKGRLLSLMHCTVHLTHCNTIPCVNLPDKSGCITLCDDHKSLQVLAWLNVLLCCCTANERR